MTKLVLIENVNPAAANLIVEQHATKGSYLSGIFMMADVKNHNQRVYPLSEIAAAVDSVNRIIVEGHTVYGELNHPDNLTIDLNNVSHIITEMRMEGANAIGKAKILNTPKGNIVKAILEGGGKLGVSSRGSGNVVEGIVNGFSLVTVDIVATPSAPDAYPNHVMESLEDNAKVMSLAEAVRNDPAAQKFFRAELTKAFEKLTGQHISADINEMVASAESQDYITDTMNKQGWTIAGRVYKHSTKSAKIKVDNSMRFTVTYKGTDHKFSDNIKNLNSILKANNFNE